MEDPVPHDYEAWRRCIEIDCGLQLSVPYINERIVELQDFKHFRTKRFIELWGPQHHEQVVSWFRRALADLEGQN